MYTSASEAGVAIVFHGRQIAAARALANVSTKDLAAAAGVTARTIGRLEVDGAISVSPKRRHGHVAKATLDKITDALRRHGVELVPEGADYGAGVRVEAANGQAVAAWRTSNGTPRLSPNCREEA
jgi:hypothetical protein